jgi:hypothetical protein
MVNKILGRMDQYYDTKRANKAASKKASPVKKAASKKKSPVKKAASKKKSPVKKAASKKKSPVKKAASKKKSPVKKASSKKKHNMKRPMSGYLYFSVDNRGKIKKDNPNMSFVDIGRALGAKWRSMDDSEKSKYNRRAQPGMESYKKKKADFEKNRLKKPMSSYLIFARDMRDSVKADNPKAGFLEISSIIGAEWNKLKSDSQKKKSCIKEASKLRKKYEDEMPLTDLKRLLENRGVRKRRDKYDEELPIAETKDYKKMLKKRAARKMSKSTKPAKLQKLM